MKKIMYVLPLVCAIILLSCNGMFASQKGANVSFKINAAELYKSMQQSNAATARNAARNMHSRDAGDDDDAVYIEVTLITNGVTRSVKQSVTMDILRDEPLSIQFSNVPTGGAAVIEIEAYSQYNSDVGAVKNITFIGRGTVASVTAGENAVPVKLARIIPRVIMMPNISGTTIDLYYRTSPTGVNIPIKRYLDIRPDSFRFAVSPYAHVTYSYSASSGSPYDNPYSIFYFRDGHRDGPTDSGVTSPSKIKGIAASASNGVEYMLDSNGNLYPGFTAGSPITQTAVTFSSADALAVTSDTTDDYVFIAGTDSSAKKIFKFSVNHDTPNNAAYDDSIAYSAIIPPGSSANAFIADMIVHEGSLWVLWRDVDSQFTSGSYYSRGALTKLNLTTLAQEGVYGTTSGNHPTTENPQNEFFGPSRFIGIMPKKLVIADDGAHAPSYDAGLSALIPQKNRIVTFDTDTSAMSAVDANVEFLYTITGSGSW